MSFLEVRNLVKDFGGLVANQDVSFFIEQGEIIGLIGPNGAGKTTLFNCIAGYYKPDSGQVLFKGQDITGWRSDQTNVAGIARTFQVMRVTTGMSVIENVMVGAFCRIDDRHVARKEAAALLSYLGLSGVSEYHLNELPIAMQRKVGLARALATKPELLMLDEVASGLNRTETDEIVDLIQRLNAERKITVFLIEHIMEMVMRVSQRVIVLDGGIKITEGLPGEIVKNGEVIKAYLGEKYAQSV